MNTGESLRDKIYIPPPPTPNTLPNPNSYFCGYGYEAAINECYHACPGGSDAECPGGRYCYGWLTCDQSDVDPATYNVCGTSWGDAAKTCGGRCFLGDDDSCPTGQSCFGAVEECKDKLGPLTYGDVGLAPPSEEEIAEEAEKVEVAAVKEEAMSDSQNWWCGKSWSNMLETCSKRCETDEDCSANSWEKVQCWRTTGGADNCQTPGVPKKAPVPPGSRWW